MTLRFGSVCSGIEAASVAWEPLDWHPQFYSEIEPFPCAVLHHHWSSGRPRFMPDPDEPGLSDKDRKARRAAIKSVTRLPEQANGVPNFGDMTQFEEWPDADIDVLVGGTPCQSYSVAGLRKGLDDPRGDLMLTYAAVARRYRPRWLVWENVFGVLSSGGGRDFASLLGLLSGRRVEVPAGGWKSSGIVEGYSGAYGLSWRVLDTQFVRVDGAPRALPQRRRRVFVVGHTGGDWRRAAAVLLERHGLSGHPAPSREARKDVAPTISARPTGGGGLGTDFDLDGGVIVDDAARCVTAGYAQRLDWETENFVAHTLLGKENDSRAADLDTYVAHSLRAEGFDASEDGTGRGTPIVPVSVAIRGREDGGTIEMGDDVAHALRASQGGGDKPHVSAPIAFNSREDPEVTFDRAGPLGSSSPQAQAIAFDTTQITSDKNYSKPMPGDPCHPLAAGAHPPALAINQEVEDAREEKANAIAALRELRRSIGAEAFAQWGLGILDSLQSSEVLRPAVHGNGLRQEAQAGREMDGGTQAGAADEGARPLREMREAGRERRTPSGSQLAKQRSRELGAYLSLLSQSGTSRNRSLRCLWEAAEGIGLLREALSTLQEARESVPDEGKPAHTTWAVRRLTPKEAARLQGFADNHCRIPWRGKPAEQCPDGPQYKAYGNSMSTNVMRWLGERIQFVDQIERADA